jgi:hypothetical protein
VKFGSSIAISVIVCNAIKILTMFYILFKIDISATLTCTGDAIACFTSRENEYTPHISMVSRRDFNRVG